MTLANPTGTVTLPGDGTTVNLADTATLQKGYFPCVSIDFKLHYTNAMPFPSRRSSDLTVTGNGMYGSGNYAVPSNGTTVTGTYTWHATYNPDGNNNKTIDLGGTH